MNNLMKKHTFWPSTSFFDDFLTRDLFDWSGRTNEGGSMPGVNIAESNEHFLVEVAAPGLKKEDFHVELDNDMLVIQAEISQSDEKKDDNYTRREFSYQSFKRSFYVPNTVEADKIEAKYVDGILRLVIPKKEEAKKKPVKTISIS